jgi:squalene-hopene/tetraprenyl-beta-curcumene cyclase
MRKTVVALICALLIASGLGTTSASTDEVTRWSPTPVDRLPTERTVWWPDTTILTGVRETGLAWLEENQAPDGRWDPDFGVNAIAAFALLNGGRGADHPVVARALANILAEVNEDGSYSEGTYVHYYTSLSVMALSAAGRAEDRPFVEDGVGMLVRDQCDGDEEGFEEWWRGGIGYGGDGRPDMSNTQFALMALAAAEAAYPSIDVPVSTWQNALVFLNRCQNLPDVNDLEWDDDTSLASYADGGFIYFPGSSKVGELDSYGSMTAAGIWCLMAVGQDTSSFTVSAAMSWLAEHFSGTQNPVLGDSGYYYYAWAAARALRTAGAPALVSPSGEELYWARELADGILERQETSGSWMNTGSDRWWEGNRVVATSFALLTIEAMLPSDGADIRIRAPEEGSVRVTDPQGRTDAEIPGWNREADGTIVIGDATEGPFDVEVRGTDGVDIATGDGGTGTVWRSVRLARQGGTMTVDVAPLLGPASLVVANVAGLPVAPGAAATSPSLGFVVTLLAVVAIAVVSGLVARRRD